MLALLVNQLGLGPKEISVDVIFIRVLDFFTKVVFSQLLTSVAEKLLQKTEPSL
jgi:bacteriorhodopsin